MIQAKEISFGYGSVLVLRQLNLLVEEGRRLLLSGPSGGGKTTLMRLLCGLLKPQSGQIIAPERLGVVFQEDRLIPGLTALGNVELISNREQARNLLAELGLAEEAQSRPDSAGEWPWPERLPAPAKPCCWTSLSRGWTLKPVAKPPDACWTIARPSRCWSFPTIKRTPPCFGPKRFLCSSCKRNPHKRPKAQSAWRSFGAFPCVPEDFLL